MQDQKSFSAISIMQRNGFSASRMTRERRTSLLVRKRPVIRRKRRMPPLRSKGRKSHSGFFMAPNDAHPQSTHFQALRGCRVITSSAYSLPFQLQNPQRYTCRLCEAKGGKAIPDSLWPPTTRTRKAHTSLALRGCRVLTESASFYSLLFNFKPPTPHISPLHSKKRISHSGSLWAP